MCFLVVASVILGLCAWLMVALFRVLSDLIRSGMFSDPDAATAGLSDPATPGPSPDDAPLWDVDSLHPG